jgi:hypothetical protein
MLEGELMQVLVLHDAHMDVRAPTHELIRAPCDLARPPAHRRRTD